MTTTQFDPGAFRQFFAQLPTGVTLIIAGPAASPVGLVVGTFASVSLHPPVVSFMVKNGSRSFQAVREIGRFTANVLASDQHQLSRTLAGWSQDKFRDVHLEENDDGQLVLNDCLAWADCVIDREVEAGDHVIVLARPLELTVVRPAARPLVFYQSVYHRTSHVEDWRAPGWS